MVAAAVTSCRRNVFNDVTPKNITGQAAENLSSRIKNFYASMKTREHHVGNKTAKTTSGETFSADSANFLMEAALNMYAVRKIDSTEVDTRTFVVTAPISSGLIDESDVSDAFWAIRDSLMELYNGITADSKELEFLEITNTVSGLFVNFKVTGAVSKGIIFGGGCPYDFSAHYASNRAFAVQGSGGSTYSSAAGSYNYGYGQGDFVSGSVINKVSGPAYPSAATLLRRFGISYYNNCVLQTAYTCGYNVNISTIDINISSANTVSSPTSDFTSTVTGFKNKDIWEAFIYYDGCDISSNLNDGQIDYKHYMNTPMLDFYLSYIPTYISNNIPSGKSFYDFNITWLYCLCAPQYSSEYGSCGHTSSYQYSITSSEFVEYPCNTWIGILSL